MKTSQKTTCSQGFTLIELLVVIAIIAILAAILFPVFAKAREKARQTACASNEKQITLGFMQYIQDFDETFPPEHLDYNDSYWPQRVYPYIKSTAIFSCPDDPTPNDIADSLASKGGDYSQISYGWNPALGITLSTSKTLAQINSPADTCLLDEDFQSKVAGQGFGACPLGTGVADTGTAGFAVSWYSCGNDTPVHKGSAPGEDPSFGFNSTFSTPIVRHTGGLNVGFTDGHVKWMRFETIYTLPKGMTDATKFKLWHPDAPDS